MVKDYDKLERENYELRQLLEITKLLSSTLDYNKLKDSILFSFMAQARCVKAAVYTKDIVTPDTLTIARNYMGFEIDPVIPVQLSCNSPAIQAITKTDSCLTKEEFFELLPNMDSNLKEYINEEVELIIPITSRENINSIVFLGGRIDDSPVSEEDKEFLSKIALYSSIALQNSILFDKATVDIMTDLKVKHYLIKSIDEAIKSGDYNFTVVMVDIDDFKKVNDTYGHQAGDETLITVANIIKNTVRSEDIAARYGGEEFVVMLRDTDIEGAGFVAERFRKEIEETLIKTKSGNIKVTVSVGIAEFSEDIDKSTEDVIERADNSLYISKNTGKNKVTKA